VAVGSTFFAIRLFLICLVACLTARVCSFFVSRRGSLSSILKDAPLGVLKAVNVGLALEGAVSLRLATEYLVAVFRAPEGLLFFLDIFSGFLSSGAR